MNDISSQTTVRTATPNDLAEMLSLVRDLAIYEESEHMLTATIETYLESFKNGHFEGIVAEVNGTVVGTAIYYRRFSTWKGPILYLEDFVVRQSHRRQGVGKLLFEAFIEVAKTRKMAMCMWQVLDWNELAMSFYNKYDVTYDKGWFNVKLYLES